MLRRLSFMEAWVIQLIVKAGGRQALSNPLLFIPNFFNTALLWFGKEAEISAVTLGGGRVIQLAETTLGDELCLKAALAAQALVDVQRQRFQIRNIIQGVHGTVADPTDAYIVRYFNGEETVEALLLGKQPQYMDPNSKPDPFSHVMLQFKKIHERPIIGRVPRDVQLEIVREVSVSKSLQQAASYWLHCYDNLQEVRRQVDDAMFLTAKLKEAGLNS